MAPIDFVHRLIQYYRGEDKDLPIITPHTAALLSILTTLLYVLPLYASAKTRPSPTLSRDAPTVIRARIRAVTFSCVVSTSLILYLGIGQGKLSIYDTLETLGWWPVNAWDILKTLALLVILFTGPLFEAGIAEGHWRDWITGRYLNESLSSSVGWRNYIAGPITEELTFRSTLLSLHLFAHSSPTTLIFLTPLYFGIAHIHHFYEFTLTHPYTPLLPSVFRTAFQFTYTSLFGFYAAFVYLRTGSVVAAILAHAFCNWMGLPRVWGRLGVEVGAAIAAPIPMNGGGSGAGGAAAGAERGKEDTEIPLSRVEVADGRLGVGWTVVYYILLVAGAYGFYKNLWTLTESENALVDFSGWGGGGGGGGAGRER